MTTNFSQTAAYIWSMADLLRGDFKQSQQMHTDFQAFVRVCLWQKIFCRF